VSPQEFPANSFPVPAGGGVSWTFVPARSRERYWLHGLLFLLTLLTTTAVGAGFQYAFARDLPFDLDQSLAAFVRAWHSPATLLSGLPFSLTLMTILLAHEMGHYLVCRHYLVDASLPYFLPAPPLLGTFGAFIRLRSAVYSKRVLFDIGIAGPLAGFVFLLPALAIGIAYSKIIPGITQQGDVQFGTPLVLRALELAIVPGVPVNDIYLHPVARAAWIGILATAFNLLPIGQLDGGHIMYSLVGDLHKRLTKIFILALVPLAIFWPAWLVWAIVLFLLARKHPMICDDSGIGRGRAMLGWLAMAIFVLCFTVVPVHSGGLK
jgi:membrane-associated protease RseP (regulator of RpoE activity)